MLIRLLGFAGHSIELPQLALTPSEMLMGPFSCPCETSATSQPFGSQVLTLASNERIPLRAHMRMIFEIRDLKYATPATVSRAGILYMSTVEGQQWNSLIASWVAGSGFNETVKYQISQLFDSYVHKCVDYLSTQMKTTVECEPTTAVLALLQVRFSCRLVRTCAYHHDIHERLAVDLLPSGSHPSSIFAQLDSKRPIIVRSFQSSATGVQYVSNTIHRGRISWGTLTETEQTNSVLA